MRMRGLQVAIAIEELGVHQAVADAAPNGEVLDVPQPGHFLQVLDRDVVPLLEHRRLVAAKDAVGVARAGHVQADGSGKAQQLVAADVALDVVQSLVDRGRIGRLEHLCVQLVARVHGQVPLEVGIGGAVLQLPQREVRAAQQLRRRRTRGVGADELRHVLDVEADAAAGRQGHERVRPPDASRRFPASGAAAAQLRTAKFRVATSAGPNSRPSTSRSRETSPPSSSSEAVVSGSTSGDWREKRATRLQRTRRTSVATSSARRCSSPARSNPASWRRPWSAAPLCRAPAQSAGFAGPCGGGRRECGSPVRRKSPAGRSAVRRSQADRNFAPRRRRWPDAPALWIPFARPTPWECEPPRANPRRPGRFPYAAGPLGPANDGGGTTPANAVQSRPLPPAWPEAAPRRRRSPRRFRRQAREDAQRNTNRGLPACNAAGRAWRRPSPRAWLCRSSPA